MPRAVLLVLVLALSACSALQPVALRDVRPGGADGPVQIGDRVEVRTFDDARLDFEVTDITADGLAGQFGFVRFDDVHSLRVRQPGASRTATTWLLGILAAGAVAALVVSADSVTLCSGAPCPPAARN